MKYKLVTSISIIISFVMLYGAFFKIKDLNAFHTDLSVSPYLHSYAGALYILVPVAESIVGISLLIPKTRLYALIVSIVCLLSFSVYLFLLNRLGADISCGCGGILSRIPTEVHILLNLILATAGLVAIYLLKWGSLSIKSQEKYGILK